MTEDPRQYIKADTMERFLFDLANLIEVSVNLVSPGLKLTATAGHVQLSRPVLTVVQGLEPSRYRSSGGDPKQRIRKLHGKGNGTRQKNEWKQIRENSEGSPGRLSHFAGHFQAFLPKP